MVREPATVSPTNEEIAQVLDEIAELFAAQDARPFRSAAYHRAAQVIWALPRPVRELADRGTAAFTALPAIGPAIARTVMQLVQTGRSGLLDRLRGQADPEALLATVSGLGPVLARRLHDQLGIHTLEELEMAAHDGRLARVSGFGRRRIRGVIEALAGRFGRRGRLPAAGTSDEAPISELLDVDREYRLKATAGSLPRIAPRRFNPEQHAWLPILHTERGTRHYTALFSNTARAHELGMTGDWVVIYRDDGARERQATVVTERRGPLAGRRVVRGRENECATYYRDAPRASVQPCPPPLAKGVMSSAS
jgi:hypothetical protein